jgi:hypothetical protein
MAPQIKLYKDETLNQTQLERLNEIFNLFKEDNPKFLSRQECMNLQQFDSFIFVFTKFDGPAFEYVRNSKGRYKQSLDQIIII